MLSNKGHTDAEGSRAPTNPKVQSPVSGKKGNLAVLRHWHLRPGCPAAHPGLSRPVRHTACCAQRGNHPEGTAGMGNYAGGRMESTEGARCARGPVPRAVPSTPRHCSAACLRVFGGTRPRQNPRDSTRPRSPGVPTAQPCCLGSHRLPPRRQAPQGQSCSHPARHQGLEQCLELTPGSLMLPRT